MYNDETLYWIWLAGACGPASKDFLRLIEKFGGPFEIYSLEDYLTTQIDGISERTANALLKKDLNGAYSVMKYCRAEGVDIITYGDKKYPSRLKTLEDPPAVLFCRGKFPDFDSRLCIAVVGTRKMSEYGKLSAYKISYELAAANVIVVSGMALGVDGVASCAAIGAKGTTVAVLGCGIDVVYPREHGVLADKIAKNGAIITEFMPTTPPDRYNFPMRNRIISGLCQGTLVVEGAHGSGALITAHTAIKQGREVFALPGKINESNSDGPNELIRSGAYAALCADDIICRYDFLYHDVIDYRSLKRAKGKSDFDSALAESFKVGVRAYRRFGVGGADENGGLSVDRSAGTELTRSEKNAPEYGGTPNTDNGAQGAQYKTASVACPPESGRERRTESGRGAKGENGKDRRTCPESTPRESDKTREILDGLDESVRRVFEDMPIDSSVSPDSLTQNGMSTSDVITALTMLELCGLVISLPGGLYMKK